MMILTKKNWLQKNGPWRATVQRLKKRPTRIKVRMTYMHALNAPGAGPRLAESCAASTYISSIIQQHGMRRNLICRDVLSVPYDGKYY